MTPRDARMRVTDDDPPAAEPVVPAGRALQFLADASALLSTSLDYEQTLRQVAGLAVPEVADWCGLFVVADDGTESEITSGYGDPELDAVLTEIRANRRARAGGASEARLVARTGEPILAPDVSRALSDDLDERQRRLVSRLAPKSYMVVALVARGRRLGSLTLLSTAEGRHYTAEDLAFAEALAARCAVAIDNARLHEEAERSLRLLDAIFATAPVGLAFVDRELRFVRINETLAALNGRSVADHLGRTVGEVLGAMADDVTDLYRRVLDSGEPIHDLEISGDVSPEQGDPRHWTVSYTPVRGGDGAVLGVTAVVIDVSERRRLLEAEQAARISADFLARASSVLEESLDYEATLRAVAGLALPAFADACSVDIRAGDGVLRQVAAAHVDPDRQGLMEELGTWGPSGAARPMLVREVTDAMLVAEHPAPEQLELLRRLAPRSMIVAALRARGRSLGTLTLLRTTSDRPFDDADVELAEELARRAGLAVDNARLYTERTRIAHTLQVRLLPERLPDIPGAVLAARYRAAGELNEVGGDFYDVFPRSAHEWAMVVGDVSGKGAEAAAITALARYTLRAGALDDDEPEQALRRLNTAMLLHEDTSQFTTAVLAYVAAVDDDQMRVRLSLAGHPPPMVVRRDGSVESTGRFGTILGLRADPVMHDTVMVLDRGDVLLLYTDGVTEAGPRSAPFGEDGLARVLATLAGQEPQAVVDAVEQAVVDAQEGQPRDDVALLALALRAR